MSMLSFKAPNLERILEWQPFQPCQEWFENNLVLIKGTPPGYFNTDVRPHAERIFKEIDKINVNMITLMTSSQTSKTTIGVGAILKYIETDRYDSMIMFPRESELSKMYDNKVKIMIDGCEKIKKKIQVSQEDAKKKTRAFGLNIDGVLLNILATNQTKSISPKFGYFDEVVEYLVGKLEEALERFKSHDGTGEKVFVTSTQHPTKDGRDVINDCFNISEVKLQYQAKCPKCKELFYPEPETLGYPTIDQWELESGESLDGIADGMKLYKILSDYRPWAGKRAYIQCPHCKHQMNNKERRKQILDKQFEWVEVEPLTSNEYGVITSWKKVEKPKEQYRSIAFDVNTLCIESYDIGNIVEQMIKAEYSHNKIIDMQVLYVGQFNRIYRTNIKKTETADILMLTNKLPWGVVPEDTAKLYFIVDTQKDHYWYMVLAVKYGKLFNVVAHGKVYEDKRLKEMMFEAYPAEDGKKRYIDRATIDMRGYQRQEKTDEDGEVVETKVNTTERIKEFIIQTNIEARQNGFIKNDEHFLWGTMGQPQIKISEKELKEAQKRGETPTGEMAILKTIENKEKPDYTYKVLYISNLAAKTELFEAIGNNIENFKNEAEEKNPTTVSNLYFINEDMKQEGLKRKNPRQEDFEQMMTAEIYDFDVVNGKPKEYKSFIPIRKRNDQLDNSATGVALASIDNIAIFPHKQEVSISGYEMFKYLKSKQSENKKN